MNPQHSVATVTVKAKRTLSFSIPHVLKIGIAIFFPYPARQMANSWHTQDGFFPHERKGKFALCFIIAERNAVNILFWSTNYP